VNAAQVGKVHFLALLFLQSCLLQIPEADSVCRWGGTWSARMHRVCGTFASGAAPQTGTGTTPAYVLRLQLRPPAWAGALHVNDDTDNDEC